MRKIIEWIQSLFRRVYSIFYVGATDMLPEPLSREAEEAYIEKMQMGDSDAKDKLIEHNLRLVVFLGKNIKLATYASRCIDNEILMHLRKNKKIKTEVSIDASLSLDGEGNELHLEDVLGTDADIVTREIEEENDKKVMLEEVMKLKPRDRDIIVLRYGLLGNDELTQKEVAEKLGISQSYISRIEKKVIKRLRTVVSNF